MVQNSTNIVENIIEWDGEALYTPPEGTFLVAIHGACNTRWLYDPATDTFTNPNPSPRPSPEVTE